MIINDIAMIINNMIIDLYNSGITFYQIILGLIIFNFIIFILFKLITIAKYTRMS